MAYKIIIDAGHGGRDPGAVYAGRQEKDDNLTLALAVGEDLENMGFDVEYTRTTDVYESPFEKAQEANNLGGDLFVSIHRNSFPTPGAASGVETLVYDKSGIKNQIAESINEQLESVGFVNLGVKERPNLVVLRRTSMPAVLVEAGFINSATDNELFDQNFPEIAQGIADGIADIFYADQNRVGAGVNAQRQSGLGESGRRMDHNWDRPSSEQDRVYTIQLGAFRNRNYAEDLLNELIDADYPAYVAEGDGYYRVRIGAYESREEAEDVAGNLRREGYAALIVE